jgi:hypothetical protein
MSVSFSDTQIIWNKATFCFCRSCAMHRQLQWCGREKRKYLLGDKIGRVNVMGEHVWSAQVSTSRHTGQNEHILPLSGIRCHNLVEIYHCFEETYCLHLWGRRDPRSLLIPTWLNGTMPHKTGMSKVTASRMFLKSTTLFCFFFHFYIRLMNFFNNGLLHCSSFL